MLNLSGLATTLTGNDDRPRGSRRRRAGLEILGAFGAASQMALLYPPGVDEILRREAERGSAADRATLR
jgi:hypothetical protein